MSKDSKRGNREVRKPKSDKKPAPTATNVFDKGAASALSTPKKKH